MHYSKRLFRFQPLTDPRWTDFLHRHPRASVFHTAEWLNALRVTYGYEPVGLTTAPPEAELQDGAVFCHVASRLTGERFVSLPFSDHCDLLIDDSTDLIALISELYRELYEHKLRYIEFRLTHALHTTDFGVHSRTGCCLHQIDLSPDIETLFRNCHRDSIQRKIRRAQRESLRYEEGRSAILLDSFYKLLLLTRRRHGLPPQSRKWFQSLIDHFGDALKIRLAFRNHDPVASILTLRYKGTLVYKYGCSDSRLHKLGGMQLLLWNSIREAKQDGLHVFDLGRTEWENTGLITFKERWGAKRSTLTYVRLLASPQSNGTYASAATDWPERVARRVLRYLPDWVFRSAGALLYRHIG